MNAIRSTAFLIAIGMATAACRTTAPAATPVIPNASLDNAAQVVNRASADSNVTKYAPDELKQAQYALRRAQASWATKPDIAGTAHLAYLAHQRGAIAIEVANQRAAEDRIKAAAAERDNLQAQARALQSAQSAPAEQQVTNEKRAQQLVAEMKALHAENSRRGMVITLPDDAFSDKPAQLRSSAMPTLDKLAAILKNNPERKVAVEGYTDSHGNEKRNLALSEERADEVRDALVERGVAADHVIVRPLGEEFPVASNNSSAGREQNRRVEIILSDSRGNVPVRRL